MHRDFATSFRGSMWICMRSILTERSGAEWIGVEQKICRDYVDELRMGGNTDKLKKAVHSNVYRTDE